MQRTVTVTIRMNMMGRISAVLKRASLILHFGIFVSAMAWSADTDNSTISRVIDQLEAVHSLSGVTISPDGHWVTWVEPAPGGVDGNVIFLADRTQPGVKPVRVTAAG